MKILKKDIKKWTDALRSGKYKQTRGRLQDAEGFCCLGVACDMFIPTPLLDGNGYLIGGTPDHTQGAAPEWLKEINDNFQKLAGILLSQLNDQSMDIGTIGNGKEYEYTEIDSLTFDEIADLIEAVYIHKVLN